MIKKELSAIVLVAIVAVIAILLVSLNTGNMHALTFLEENIIGEAIKALTGKTCGTSQKTLCQQLQNRCATMKGTWKGNCKTCSIKCDLSKKK